MFVNRKALFQQIRAFRLDPTQQSSNGIAATCPATPRQVPVKSKAAKRITCTQGTADLFNTLPCTTSAMGADFQQPLRLFIYELGLTSLPFTTFELAVVSREWAAVAKLVAGHVAFMPTRVPHFVIINAGASGLWDNSLSTQEEFFAPSLEVTMSSETAVQIVRAALQNATEASHLTWNLGPNAGFRNAVLITAEHLCQLLDMSYSETVGALGSVARRDFSPGWLSGDFLNALARVYMPDILGLSVQALASHDALPKVGFLPDYHFHLLQKRHQESLERYALYIAKSFRMFAGGSSGVACLLQMDWVSTFVNHQNVHWSFLAARLAPVNGRKAIIAVESTAVQHAGECEVLCRYVCALSAWYEMLHPGQGITHKQEEFDFIFLRPQGKLSFISKHIPTQRDSKSCGVFTALALYAVAKGKPFVFKQSFVPLAREIFLQDFLNFYHTPS